MRLVVLLALFSLSVTAQNPTVLEPKSFELPLVLGISRIVQTPSDVGNIVLPDPSKVEFRRITEGKQTRKLLLLPKAVGSTEIVVNDPVTKAPAFRYRVSVAAPTEEGITEQKRLDGVDGIAVLDVSLTRAESRQLAFDKPLGPVFLTDPSRALYRRLGQPNVGKTLLLIGGNAGVTDLVVHDSHGKIQSKLYLHVR